MSKFFALVITMAMLMFTAGAYAQTSTMEAPTTTSGPAAATTDIKAAPPRSDEFGCTVNESYVGCMCEGVEDCLALKSSGRCTSKIDIFEDGKTGECSTDTGGKMADDEPLKFKARTDAGSTASSMSTKAIANGSSDPSEYSCDYDKNGDLIECACDDLGDCLKLADAGNCGSKKITEFGRGGICK